VNRRTRAAGLALVELLVLVGAMTFLLLILLTLKRPTLDSRMACGTKLAGIGKAILLYSNDYRDELPRAGRGNSEWTGRVADWQAKDRDAAYGSGADGAGQVSISASLYLLVKYTEVEPKSFVCRGEKKVKEFKLETYLSGDNGLTLRDLWDFGPNPPRHCSYAYQMLYGGPKRTVSAEPDMAIAADRNPWMDAPAAKARNFSLFTPDLAPFNGAADQARQGNTSRHEGDGQNVMFLDTHVTFKKRSTCGVENDNIYTSWDGTDRVRGKPPKVGTQPGDAKDSLLVNDPPVSRKR
jgi:hypothetical protein